MATLFVAGMAALIVLMAVLSVYFNGWLWQVVLRRFFAVTVDSVHRIAWYPVLPGFLVGLLAIPLSAQHPPMAMLVNFACMLLPPVALHLLVPDDAGAPISLGTSVLSYLALLAVALALGLVVLLAIGLAVLVLSSLA